MHVSDLTAFFARLVDALINGSPVPKGRQGYYFTNSHRVYWWDLVERLAEVLHARGLVADPSVGIWPSDEAAGKAFGVPPAFAASIFNGRYVSLGTFASMRVCAPSIFTNAALVKSTDVVGENSKTLGWQPAWSRDKMLDKAGDEVDDALELGEPKSSLLSSLTSQK